MNTGDLTKGISCLYAEAFNDTVEDNTAVIAISAVGREVLHCPRTLTGEELDTDIPSRGVNYSPSG